MSRHANVSLLTLGLLAVLCSGCSGGGGTGAALTNTAPTAGFTLTPGAGDLTTIFSVDASGSSDAQDAASSLQVRWDWNGDGTYDTDFTTTKTATHQYATAGTYLLRLQVKNTGGLTATAAKTVVVKPTLTVIPNPVTLTLGQPQTFTAQVQGSATTTVTWQLQEAGEGSITTGGHYTAPQVPGTFHIIATCVADTTVSVTVPVLVQATSGTVTVQ